jgi:hypothetical protein
MKSNNQSIIQHFQRYLLVLIKALMESLRLVVVYIQIVEKLAHRKEAMIANTVVIVANAAQDLSQKVIIANVVTTASTLSASVAPVLKLIFAANAATIAIVMIASRLTTHSGFRVCCPGGRRDLKPEYRMSDFGSID